MTLLWLVLTCTVNHCMRWYNYVHIVYLAYNMMDIILFCFLQGRVHLCWQIYLWFCSRKCMCCPFYVLQWNLLRRDSRAFRRFLRHDASLWNSICIQCKCSHYTVLGNDVLHTNTSSISLNFHLDARVTGVLDISWSHTRSCRLHSVSTTTLIVTHHSKLKQNKLPTFTFELSHIKWKI